jgi:microcystin degradation protein MlrC
MSSTIVEPCKKIYKNLNIFNKLNGINDCNLLIGYVWADTKRATASAIVNCSDVNIGKRICKKIALSYWNNRFNLVYDMKSYKLNKIFHVVNKKRFTILADSGDNPTAGGVGNRIDVLEYVFKNKIENTLFAGIYNEEIFRELKNKKNKIVIKDNISKKKISISIDKFYLKNDNAIVISNNNTVIFTKYRKPFHYLSDFRELNINLKKYKILIVKSGYLSPELKKLKADNFMILTDGFVTQDFKRIKNLFREKPIYPFQKNFRYNIAI